MTPEKGNFQARRRRLRRLVEALKIFDSKYQNRTIGENCQSRYAPLHLPSHVARVMNSAPQVRQRFPSRSLKPFPHTPMASSRLPRGRNREGRSFPAIGLHLLEFHCLARRPWTGLGASCGTMNLVYPEPDSS